VTRRVVRADRVDVPGGAPADLSGAGFPLRRAGRHTPRTAAARLAPPSWEPAALTALSRWVPRPPRGPLGRAVAYVWASPVTVAGLLAGLAAGSRPRVRDGVLLFADAKGLAGRMLMRRGYDATAIGHVVVARSQPSELLMTHELVHVRQAERFGPFMAPLYLGLHLLYGYARHPMERAARRAVRLRLGAPE
jgi:hypothetical protein